VLRRVLRLLTGLAVGWLWAGPEAGGPASMPGGLVLEPYGGAEAVRAGAACGWREGGAWADDRRRGSPPE